MPWFVAGGQPQWVNEPMGMLGATMGQGVSRPGGAGYAPNTAQQTAWAEAYAQEQRRQWDADHQQKQQQLDQQYEIAKRNASSSEEAREIDRWYRQQSVQIERERLAQNDRQFNATHGLAQAKLGYDLLGMASQLRGPENVFQAAAFSRGLADVPETPTFLNALRGNSNLSAFGAQGGVPNPETLDTLMAKIGGGPAQGAGGGNPDAALSDIRSIAAGGAHQIKNLHKLNPLESGIFQSGLDAAGVHTPTFLSQYRRSRPNNQMSMANVA